MHARAMAGSAAPHIDLQQALLGLLVLLFTGAVLGLHRPPHRALRSLACSLEPRSGGRRPQKFHATPTPRIGGLRVMASLFVAGRPGSRQVKPRRGEQFGYLLLASLPAFLGGITEDVTKSVSVAARLMLTMAAAAIGVVLLGAVIPRLDVPGFDSLLRWSPFAIAFTAFAVSGVANSINIIDGYNGPRRWPRGDRARGDGQAIGPAGRLVPACFRARDDRRLASAFSPGTTPAGKYSSATAAPTCSASGSGELSVLIVTRHPESLTVVSDAAARLSDIRDALFDVPQEGRRKAFRPGNLIACTCTR